ncbi:MAG: 50S ribosomal protein L10 [Candidatus Eiseniibacteriota bacterium]|jgi:large subunit ribosomal protein L10
MPTPQKEAVVQELAEQFRVARGVVFADYRGLDVEAMTELRRRCREASVRFRIAKNTLSRLAISEAGLESVGDALTGPTGLALADDDELAPARVLVDFAKENDKLAIKAGVVDGRLYGIDEVKALAALPPRDQLLAQLLSVIEQPLVGVIGVAQRLVQDVLSCAEQAAEGKGEPQAAGDAAAAAAPAGDTAPADAEADAAGDAGPASGAGADSTDSSGSSESSPPPEPSGDSEDGDKPAAS